MNRAVIMLLNLHCICSHICLNFRVFLVRTFNKNIRASKIVHKYKHISLTCSYKKGKFTGNPVFTRFGKVLPLISSTIKKFVEKARSVWVCDSRYFVVLLAFACAESLRNAMAVESVNLCILVPTMRRLACTMPAFLW